jgi:hypothetical protein
MTIDQSGKKLYVNLPGTDEIGVVDLAARKMISKWPLPDAQNARAIALDEPHHWLFVATRKPPRFLVFNTHSSKLVTALDCVGVNSDMWIDVARKRIYVTGSDTASVFEQRDADHYEHVAEVPTAYRAKSSMFVPQLKRLMLPIRGKADQTRIWLFEFLRFSKWIGNRSAKTDQLDCRRTNTRLYNRVSVAAMSQRKAGIRKRREI